MRHAKDFVHYVSLSAQGLETTRLRLNSEINASNVRATTRFIDAVRVAGRTRPALKRGWHVWEGISRELIAKFLREFDSDPLKF